MTEDEVYYGGEGDFINDMEGGMSGGTKGTPNEIYSVMKNEKHLSNTTTVELAVNLQQPDAAGSKDTIEKLASLDTSIAKRGDDDDKSVCLLYLIQDACIQGKKVSVRNTMNSFSKQVKKTLAEAAAEQMVAVGEEGAERPAGAVVAPAEGAGVGAEAGSPRGGGNLAGGAPSSPTAQAAATAAAALAAAKKSKKLPLLIKRIEPKKEFFGYDKENPNKLSIPSILKGALFKANIIQSRIEDFDDNNFTPEKMLKYYTYYFSRINEDKKVDITEDDIDTMKEYLNKGFMGETYTGLSLTYNKDDLKRSIGVGYFSKTVDSLRLLSKIKKDSKDDGRQLCDIILFVYGIILKKYVTIIAKQKTIEREERDADVGQLNIKQYALVTLLTSLADLDGILKIIDDTFGNTMLSTAFNEEEKDIRLSYLLMKKSREGKGKSIIDLLFELLFDANHNDGILQKYDNEIRAIQNKIGENVDGEEGDNIRKNDPKNRKAEYTQIDLSNLKIDSDNFFTAWVESLKTYPGGEIESLANGYLITKQIFKRNPIEHVVERARGEAAVAMAVAREEAARANRPLLTSKIGSEAADGPRIEEINPDTGLPIESGGAKKSIKKRAKKRNKTKQVKKSKRYAKKK